MTLDFTGLTRVGGSDAGSSTAPPPAPSTGINPSGLTRVGSTPSPSAFDEAAKQYPIIKNFDVNVISTPIAGDHRKLEFWPAGEEGDAEYPRPKEFPIDKPGIQIISPDTTPSDVAADIVSHQLVNTDPTLKPLYDKFAAGFDTPKGQALLKEDYARAKAHGESRPIAVWAKTDRIPAYFRGRVFKQWEGQLSEQDWNAKLSPQQLSLLDQMSSIVTSAGDSIDFTGLKKVTSVDLSGLKAVGPARGVDRSAAQPIAAAAPDNSGGFFHEAGAAFKRSILSQNPQSLADSLDMGSVLAREDASPTLANRALKFAGRISNPIGGFADDIGAVTGIHASDVLKSASDTVRGWAGAGDDGSKPAVPTLGDIHSMADAVSYVGNAIGNAGGSSAPSLVSGLAVSAATENPVAGFFAGAFGPSYIQNSGDTYATLRDNPGVQQAIKDGKITDKQVAGWAAAASVPIAALDAFGAEKMLPIQKLKGEIVSRVLKRILIGGLTEGGTEGFQQVLQESTLAAVGGDHTAAQAAMNVIENAVQGAVGGTAVSAVTAPFGNKAEQPSAQAGASVAGGVDASTVTEGAGGRPPPSAPSRDTKINVEIDKSVDRPNSPRLTAADRASPLPNDLIDDGKKIFEEALGKKAIDVPTSDIATPAMRAEAERRAADIAAPASQAAAPAIERTIEGTLTPAEAAGAPGASAVASLDFTGLRQISGPTQAAPASVAAVAGPTINGDWTQFKPDSGTLNVPRSEMPQIKAEHRGAMVNFLEARGIGHQSETVPAGDLKPTQAEFSLKKVEQAKGFEGGDRSILVSSDGYVLDGHHQWLAKLDAAQPVDVIRLDAPMKDLLPVVSEFPSATTAPTKAAQNITQNIPATPMGPAAQTALKQKIKAKREAALPPITKQRAPQRVDTPDIVQFLASKGGVQDFQGELKSLDLKRHFVPGSGKLVRETGMNLDRAREAAQEVGKRLRAELDRLGLKDVGLRVSEFITTAGGMRSGAEGRFSRKVVDEGGGGWSVQRLIQIALETDNPDAVLDHEAIHALRDVGVLNPEWPMLARKSAKEWVDKYGIAETYGDRPREAQIEEGVAHAYADWREGARMDGIIARAFKRIRSVLLAIGRAFGKDFRTIDDVFQQIASGEVGARPRAERSRPADEERFALRRAATAPGPAQRRTTPPISILPNISTVASSVSTRIMNAIKGGPGKNDGETIRGYSARKITDYLDPLKRMIDSAGPAVTDATNAYQEARLAIDTGIASIQEMHRDFVTPSILALHRVGASLDDLHRYLYALHTEERNRVVGLRNDPKSDFYKAASDPSIVGASGWSTNQAVRELQKLRADLKKYAGIREAGRLYRQMLDENLLAQKNAGLISDASYNSLTQQWKNYVGLHADEGVDENGDFQMPGRGRGFDVRGKEFKGATGRFSEAENIPGWAIAQMERSKLRQAKEPVGQALLRFIAQFDPMGTKFADVFWAESSPPAPGGIQKAPTVYKRELDKSGMVVSKAVPYSTISPEMYATKIGGKAYYIQFTDPKVGAALKNMNALQLNLALRVLRMGTNLVSLVNTRLNPEFVYRNFFRDALTALVHLTGFNTKETAKVYSDIPSAWAAVWNAQRGHPGTGPMDQALAELTKTGGRIIFEQQKTVEDSIASLHAQMKAAAAGALSPQRAWESVKKLVGDVNDTVEMGMRLAAYKGMRAKGKTPKQASLAIRDLTVDFRKHGEFGPTGNAFYAFFNASVQGSVNVIKNLATSRRAQKFAGGLILTGFVMDMLNRSLSGNDDDGENIYDKMLREEPWKFERQMILFYGPGKNSYFTIPLAYGYNVFAYMGLQASAAAHGNVSGLEAISNTLRVGFDAYNPIGGSGDFLTMLLPTGLTPFWEVKTNKNFADIPIYPDQQHGDTTPDSHMQQFTKTPGAYRFLAEQLNDWTGGNKIESGAIDVHPESIKHIADFVTGGLGRFFMGVEDPIQKAVTGHAGDIDVGQLPFVRTMYGSWSEQSRKSEYYKLREAVGAADDQNQKYKDGKEDPALAADYETFKAEHKVEIDTIPAFDAAEKRLGKLRKQQRRLEADKEHDHAAQLEANADAQKIAMDNARIAYARNAAKAR